MYWKAFHETVLVLYISIFDKRILLTNQDR